MDVTIRLHDPEDAALEDGLLDLRSEVHRTAGSPTTRRTVVPVDEVAWWVEDAGALELHLRDGTVLRVIFPVDLDRGQGYVNLIDKLLDAVLGRIGRQRVVMPFRE